MALILLTVSMQKFLIRSFWAFRCCLTVKTAWPHAPMVVSTTPTTTPQKNSLVRTFLIHSMEFHLQTTLSYSFIAFPFHTPLICALKPITLFSAGDHHAKSHGVHH